MKPQSNIGYCFPMPIYSIMFFRIKLAIFLLLQYKTLDLLAGEVASLFISRVLPHFLSLGGVSYTVPHKTLSFLGAKGNPWSRAGAAALVLLFLGSLYHRFATYRYSAASQNLQAPCKTIRAAVLFCGCEDSIGLPFPLRLSRKYL
jgi:hypothetical protein